MDTLKLSIGTVAIIFCGSVLIGGLFGLALGAAYEDFMWVTQ